MELEFKHLRNAVARQFQKMVPTGLFRVRIDQNEEDETAPAPKKREKGEPRPSRIWDAYLASFPEGSNPIYKVRTEHDCSCCRGFIKKLGSVVTIAEGKLVTVWDFKIAGAYQEVADTMAALIRKEAAAHGIHNVFLHTEKVVGIEKNIQNLGGPVRTWEHFFVNLPTEAVAGADIGGRLSDTRATRDVMFRSLKELTLDATDTVLDLIAQNSLYRGEEQKFALESFRKFQVEFAKLKNDEARDLYCWARIKAAPPSVTRIRNTALGTLLVNLSDGMDLEDAVKAWEKVMAPTNYKRPTALVTKAMIAKAQETLKELGLLSALDRRYAVSEDISVTNVLFADREARKIMADRASAVFEDLADRVPEKLKNLDKVEEVSMDDFLNKILPRTTSLEAFVENRHAGNFVSLIAPTDPTARRLFKWDNPFSWCYTGELTDSIKQRVKAAGGKIDADFRASLSWYNNDDLDLHLKEPTGDHVYYHARRSRHGAHLDIDMNGMDGLSPTRTPVENIVYAEKRTMPEGVYTLYVQQYAPREKIDVGFAAEIEFEGQLWSFGYEKALPHGQNIVVAKFQYSRKEGFKILESLPAAQTSKTIWGVPTQTFRKVNIVALSPNHWDDRAVGNRHVMFFLDGCVREGTARGFYNEYLAPALEPHRKVMEMVGSRMKTETSDRQLSGIGLSATKKDHLLVRVKGAVTRPLKIVI